MASLYKKVVSGKPYWYLREMARVDGKPKMVSERYLGSGADIEALLDAREGAAVPERTRHLGFGGVAATSETSSTNSAASRKRSSSTPRPADAPKPVGCSPRPTKPKTSSPRSSTSPGGHPELRSYTRPTTHTPLTSTNTATPRTS